MKNLLVAILLLMCFTGCQTLYFENEFTSDQTVELETFPKELDGAFILGSFEEDSFIKLNFDDSHTFCIVKYVSKIKKDSLSEVKTSGNGAIVIEDKQRVYYPETNVYNNQLYAEQLYGTLDLKEKVFTSFDLDNANTTYHPMKIIETNGIYYFQYHTAKKGWVIYKIFNDKNQWYCSSLLRNKGVLGTSQQEIYLHKLENYQDGILKNNSSKQIEALFNNDKIKQDMSLSKLKIESEFDFYKIATIALLIVLIGLLFVKFRK